MRERQTEPGSGGTSRRDHDEDKDEGKRHDEAQPGVTPAVPNRLVRAALAGPSARLPAHIRRWAELTGRRPGIGVLRGAAVDQIAASVGAPAFSVGGFAAMARDAPRPATAAGAHLLRHEVSHAAPVVPRPAADRLAAVGPRAGRGSGVGPVAVAPHDGRDERAVAAGNRPPGHDPATIYRWPPAAPPTTGLLDWPTNAPADLRANLRNLMRSVTVEPDIPGLAVDMAAEAENAASYLAAPEQVEEMERRASALVALTVTSDSGDELPVGTLLNQLHTAFQRAAGVGGLDLSFGIERLIGLYCGDASDYLLDAIDQNPVVGALARGNVVATLNLAYDAHISGEVMLVMEMEGTVDKLRQLRIAFGLATEQEERASIGQAIGEVARRALLLDRLYTELSTPDDQGLKDLVVSRAMSKIAAAAETASGQEVDTLSELGNDPERLAIEHVAFEAESDDSLSYSAVRPEEAFPQAVDDAEEDFMGDLRDRIESQAEELELLRAAVLPAEPTYSIAEFAGVHRRWHAMFSNFQEEQEVLPGVAIDLMGDTYSVAGTDTGDALLSAEQGLARGFLMDIAVMMFTGPRTVPNPKSIDSVLGSRPERDVQVRGSATGPTYEFAELYGRGARSESGEQASRARTAGAAYRSTSAEMTELAERPVSERTVGGLPVVGARPTTPEEGWSYLVDVFDPTDPAQQPAPIAKEQKTIPPEVVAYLMARRQAGQTVAGAHTPTAGGRRIGGAGMRAGGVEGASGMAADWYLEGAPASDHSRSATRLAATRRTAAESLEIDLDKPQRGGGGSIALSNELWEYLETFFDERQSQAERVAAILAIAGNEYRIADKFERFTDVGEVAEMVAVAMSLAAGLQYLNGLGPYGRLAGLAVSSYLRSQGVSDLAAAISVGLFVTKAGDAATFSEARGWAMVARSVADDLASLLENAITSPVADIAGRLASKPATPTELGDAIRPAVDDPATRDLVLEAVEGKLDQIRSEVGDDPHASSSAENEALTALHDSILGRSTAEAGGAADEAFPGLENRADPLIQALDPTLRPDAAANRAEVDRYLGQRIDDLDEPPAGYQFYSRNGRRLIRRIRADDALFARLTVDADGRIRQAGRARVPGTRLVALTGISRPASLTDASLQAAVEQIRADPSLLRRRLPSLERPTDGTMGSGDFGNLKGNIAEILAKPVVASHVERIQQDHSGAQHFETARVRLPNGDGTYRNVEFSDGIVATVHGDSLQLHLVVEVKGRPQGGADAQSQVHEWIESRVDDGRNVDTGEETGGGALELIVDGETYVYDPGSGRADQVVGLARAERLVVAPEGAEGYGRDSADQVSREPTRVPLAVNDAELRYLTRLIAESWSS